MSRTSPTCKMVHHSLKLPLSSFVRPTWFRSFTHYDIHNQSWRFNFTPEKAAVGEKCFMCQGIFQRCVNWHRPQWNAQNRNFVLMSEGRRLPNAWQISMFGNFSRELHFQRVKQPLQKARFMCVCLCLINAKRPTTVCLFWLFQLIIPVQYKLHFHQKDTGEGFVHSAAVGLFCFR